MFLFEFMECSLSGGLEGLVLCWPVLACTSFAWEVWTLAMESLLGLMRKAFAGGIGPLELM